MALISIPLANLGFSEKYFLQIDENSFDLEHDFDGKILAMKIDNELNSLLIGIEDYNDSVFSIDLPTELINAENNEFAILVNGYEVDYELTPKKNSVQLEFFVPFGAEEIEIIGTHVIPEFSFNLLITMSLLFASIIFLTKSRKLNFR